MSSRIKSAIKRMLAGVLAAAISVVLMPVGAAVNADANYLPDANTSSNAVYKDYDSGSTTGNDFGTDFGNGLDHLDENEKLGNSTTGLQHGTSGTKLMYVLGFKNLDFVSADTDYIVKLPKNLVMSAGGSQELKGDDGVTIYGMLTWSAGASEATVRFNSNKVDVSEGRVALGCVIDAGAQSQAHGGKIPIDIPNAGTISVGVDGWEEGAPTPPGIDKSVSSATAKPDEEVTWTITYTPYAKGANNGPAYTGDIPAILKDEVDSNLVVTAITSLSVAGATANKDDVDLSGNTISYTLPNDGKDEVVITYTTVYKDLTSDDKLDWWSSGSNKNIDNTVNVLKSDNGPVMKESNPLTSTAPLTVTSPGRTKISKNGTLIDNDRMEWEISVDPAGINTYSKFEIYDTLGSSLIAPENTPTNPMSVQVQAEGDTTATDVAFTNINVSGQNITLDLKDFVNSKDGKSFVVHYSTKIEPSFFTSMGDQNTLKNRASLDWDTKYSETKGGGEGPAANSTDKAPAVSSLSGLGNIKIPIKKESLGYDWGERRAKWKVTVGFAGTKFNQFKIEDVPSVTVDNNDKSQFKQYDAPWRDATGGPSQGTQSYVDPTGSADAADVDSVKATMKARIVEALIANGITDADASMVNVSEVSNLYQDSTIWTNSSTDIAVLKRNHMVITVDVSSSIVRKYIYGELAFDIDTYTVFPNVYAGNNSGSHLGNGVILREDGTYMFSGDSSDPRGTKLGADQLASATVGTNGTFLAKSVTSFDPATDNGTITWKLALNAHASKIDSPLKISDNLDGKAGTLIYTTGSATIGVSPFDEEVQVNAESEVPTATAGITKNTVYYTADGTKIWFIVKQEDIDCKTTDITYKMHLDVNNSDEFKKAENKEFKYNNHAYARVEDPLYPGSFSTKQNCGSDVNNVKIPNHILEKNGDNIVDSKRQQKIDFTIKINPYSMDLLADGDDIEVSDKMDPGLVLDDESVKIYKAVHDVKKSGNDFTGTTLIKDEDVTAGANVKYDSKTNIMTFNIKDETPYIITYEVYITRSSSTNLNNEIELSGISGFDDEVGSVEAGGYYRSLTGGLMLPKFMQARFLTVSIKKVDEGGTGLAGAKFGLYDRVDGTLLAEGFSDEHGFCNFNIAVKDLPGGEKPDTVYVKEISAPSASYQLSDTWIPLKTGDLGLKGEDGDVSFTNFSTSTPLTGKIKITKVDADNSAIKLKDAWFSVYSDAACTTLIKSGKTDATGTLVIGGLKAGSTYYVKETLAPETYVLDATTVHTLTANNDETDAAASKEIKNVKAEGKIKVKKVDKADATKTLAGAKFNVYGDASCTGTSIATSDGTNAAGEVTIEGIKKGNSYWLKEIETPEGYEIEGDGIIGPVIASDDGLGTGYRVVTNKKKEAPPKEDPPKQDPPKEDPPKQDPPAGTPEKPGGGNSGGSTGGGGGSPSGPGTGGGSPSGSTPITSTPKPVDKTPEVKPETETYAPPVVDPNKPIKVDFVTPHGETPDPQIKTPGQTADDPGAPMDPSTLKPGDIIDGYRFDGWYLDPEYTMLYDFTNPLLGDTTLYAKWTKLGTGFRSPKTADEFDPIRLLVPMFAFLVGYMCIPVTSRKKK